jgi:allophanate hydrolase subunit 2
MIARVLAAGLSTIQDSGRGGFEEIGVPAAGAWHRGRYAALALLFGQESRDVPSIELIAGEVRLRFDVATDCAVSGPAHVRVDGHGAAADVVLTVHPGAEVSVRPVDRGPVYIGVSGWAPERVLGSCSFDTFSRLGGRPLAVGDSLMGEPRITGQAGWFLRPEERSIGPLRLVLGPDRSASEFCTAEWTVVSGARSGTRLGTSPWHPPRESMDSIPVLPGAVQVTPDGEAIILGVDGGLTGGYPVVGVVATVDFDRVSTLARGDALRFEPISPIDAAATFERRTRSQAGRLVDPSRLD